MKTIKMKHLTINKKTVANLDVKQMNQIHGGEDFTGNGCTETPTLCIPHKCPRPPVI